MAYYSPIFREREAMMSDAEFIKSLCAAMDIDAVRIAREWCSLTDEQQRELWAMVRSALLQQRIERALRPAVNEN